MQLRHYYSPKCRNDVEANRRWKATLRRSSHRGRARLHPLFGGALLATPSADRTLNHPSTTTLRRSCKQLPSRFPPIARWLVRRSVALHRQAGCLCYLAVATHRTRSPIFCVLQCVSRASTTGHLQRPGFAPYQDRPNRLQRSKINRTPLAIDNRSFAWMIEPSR
jgi:hypothetical protein